MKQPYSSKVILLISKIRGYNIANKPKKTLKVGKKSVDGLGVVELEDQHDIETSTDEKISMESLFFSLFFKSMSHPTLSKIGIEKTHHHYSPWSFSNPAEIWLSLPNLFMEAQKQVAGSDPSPAVSAGLGAETFQFLSDRTRRCWLPHLGTTDCGPSFTSCLAETGCIFQSLHQDSVYRVQ